MLNTLTSFTGPPCVTRRAETLTIRTQTVVLTRWRTRPYIRTEGESKSNVKGVVVLQKLLS